MNAPLDIARHPSVCPHDCPSVCALDVEVIGGNRIGRVHGAADHPYTQGRRLRESGALFRAHPSSRPADTALAARRPERFGAVCPDLLGRGARPRRRGLPEGRARMRRRKRLALFLRRHDGPRDARRDRPPDPRQALFPLFRQHLRRHRLARLHRRNRTHVRHFAGGNGEVRGRRHLGHQRRRDPGQSDDPCDARPQRARRQDRRDRHLSDRDDAAGGPRAATQARDRRRARLRGDACALPRWPRRPRLHGALCRRARRARSASARPHARMGERDHRAQGRGDRGFRGARRAT